MIKDAKEGDWRTNLNNVAHATEQFIKPPSERGES